MDTMFENLDFRFDKENNDERPFMIACKDREIMDGERWVLVSLSTDEAKRHCKIKKIEPLTTALSFLYFPARG